MTPAQLVALADVERTINEKAGQSSGNKPQVRRVTRPEESALFQSMNR